MNKITEEDRARAEVYLRENWFRYATMIDSNEKAKQNGSYIQTTWGPVAGVWADVEKYVKTNRASDALILAALDDLPPQEIHKEKTNQNTSNYKLPFIIGSIVIIFIYIFLKT